ncbi:hypothetical protein AGLY_002362 [Aphis glycines]|uniref:Uncharacterized protein n=1 Tax=Aphis glycines TaxID=307491 RepID=A0A6G0U5K5_APHGL|nr:hypothetical protein AGLY_002362 [Aphis glycines]
MILFLKLHTKRLIGFSTFGYKHFICLRVKRSPGVKILDGGCHVASFVSSSSEYIKYKSDDSLNNSNNLDLTIVPIQLGTYTTSSCSVDESLPSISTSEYKGELSGILLISNSIFVIIELILMQLNVPIEQIMKLTQLTTIEHLNLCYFVDNDQNIQNIHFYSLLYNIKDKHNEIDKSDRPIEQKVSHLAVKRYETTKTVFTTTY